MSFFGYSDAHFSLISVLYVLNVLNFPPSSISMLTINTLHWGQS